MNERLQQKKKQRTTLPDYRFYLLPKIVSSFDYLKNFVSHSITDMYNHFFSRHIEVAFDWTLSAHTLTKKTTSRSKRLAIVLLCNPTKAELCLALVQIKKSNENDMWEFDLCSCKRCYHCLKQRDRRHAPNAAKN